MKHYPPTLLVEKFHCALCGVYAAQAWYSCLTFRNSSSHRVVHDKLKACFCSHCEDWSFWFETRMVIPSDSSAPPAHPEMPKECLSEYEEARQVLSVSPRAAAALLRLALQKMMTSLGGTGKSISDDIADLVAGGLPPEIQKALDYCRVVGNNAVHPGELDLNDTPEIAHNIFGMLNFIVADRIARPKQIDELYRRLPEGARNSVDARDKPKKT